MATASKVMVGIKLLTLWVCAPTPRLAQSRFGCENAYCTRTRKLPLPAHSPGLFHQDQVANERLALNRRRREKSDSSSEESQPTNSMPTLLIVYIMSSFVQALLC